MTGKVRLAKRFGSGISNPQQQDLQAALGELFHEDKLQLREGDLEEHPNSWLEYGFQNEAKWTIYLLDVYRGGMIRFVKYEDQDDAEPAFEHTIDGIDEKTALSLSMLLMERRFDEITHRLLKG